VPQALLFLPVRNAARQQSSGFQQGQQRRREFESRLVLTSGSSCGLGAPPRPRLRVIPVRRDFYPILVGGMLGKRSIEVNREYIESYGRPVRLPDPALTASLPGSSHPQDVNMAVSKAESVSRALFNASPPAVRSGLRRLRHTGRNLADLVMDRVPWLGRMADTEEIPSHLLTAAEISSFRQIGDRFLKYFVDLGELRSDHAVLEVGSGPGRMALPLTKHLTTGSYVGFDVMAESVRWCRRAISSRHRNFRFEVADIYNGVYNPGGRSRASNYRFPYPDAHFDFVFLTSVFTHLLPPDMENYLHEVTRVMKPGARCLITFFLLNAESRQLTNAGRSSFAFTVDEGRYATVAGESSESAIAYDEVYVSSLMDANGLRDRDVRYGNWCRRPSALDYQDLVFATRVSP
jgi:SAM-dependent methyltransferase